MSFNKEKWKNIDFSKYVSEVKSSEKGKNIITVGDYDFNDLKINNNPDSKINGIPFAIKDNIAINGKRTTSALSLLSNFKINYNATIFEKLTNSGSTPIFKSNLDQLSMGGTGLESYYGEVKHPYKENSIIGGSSSGSAYFVGKGIVPFSIGTDTGDSVRKPAAYTGTVGFKPTWGLVSRYGVFDFAPTWDTVGWFTKTVTQSAILMDILQGYDEKDFSSIKPKEKDFEKNILSDKKYKIGVIKNLLDLYDDKRIVERFKWIIEKAKKDGHEIVYIELDKKILSTISLVYKIISSVESFSVNSSLTGFLFGESLSPSTSFDESISKVRGDHIGLEVKKRWIFATESINNGKYLKMTKLRKLIIDELNRGLELCDAFVMPSHNRISFNLDEEEIKNNNWIEDYLSLFNANGSPSLTLPINKDQKESIGINISGKPFNDLTVFKISKIFEDYNE